jgi:hypothetical protein
LTLVSRGADEIVRMMGLGVREPDVPPDEIPTGLGKLGFGLDSLEALEEQVTAAMEQSQDVFGGGN